MSTRSVGGARFAASRLRRSGTDPLSVLVAGDEMFVDGPASADGHRLVERLADEIVARTGRGLDLDAAWDLSPVLRAVDGASDAWRLWRYNLVVVFVPEPVGPRGRRATRAAEVTDRIVPDLAEASHVLLVRLSEKPAAVEGSALEHRDSSIASIVVPMRRERPAHLALEHVDRIAASITLLLAPDADEAPTRGATTAAALRALPKPEKDRQHAVDHLMRELGGLTLDLQRVVLLAKNTFDVPFAQVNLVTHGRVRTLAYVGVPGDSADQPVCNVTVQGSGATIIPDTWLDRRLDSNPHVHGGTPVRYYAGHPIESVDGYRIGTLCVFDLIPHEAGEDDAAALRDLALLAEAEISAAFA